MAGQMERRGRECACVCVCVSLIDGGIREWRGGCGSRELRRLSGGWGRGEHVEQCQNHRHICCSSRMFSISYKCFLQPCERHDGLPSQVGV